MVVVVVILAAVAAVAAGSAVAAVMLVAAAWGVAGAGRRPGLSQGWNIARSGFVLTNIGVGTPFHFLGR